MSSTTLDVGTRLLTLRPGPSRDTPAGFTLAQYQGHDRAELLLLLALGFVGKGFDRDDHISVVAGDINVPGSAKGDDAIGNLILFCINLIGVPPPGACPRTVPLVRRNVVDDRSLIGALPDHCLHVDLVEAVHPPLDDRHHLGRGSRHVLVGVLDRTLLESLDPKDASRSVGEMFLTQPPPPFALPSESCRTAAERMVSSGLERLPVVTDPVSMRLVGIVSRSDLLKPQRSRYEEEMQREGIFRFGGGAQ